LSPQEALRVYQERALRQRATLAEYSNETTINAEVPAMSERGTFWLKQTFLAPQSMAYTPVKFEGDGFINHNVITRLLQPDVERVHRGTGQKVAILESNYKFSYKGIEDLNGRHLYAFALKPRRKDPGLFKGKILIDSQTGHMIQAAGRLRRSPSWWIKQVDFIQDYADVGDFTMLTQIRSVTQARVVGQVTVNIRHSEYEVRSVEQLKSAQRKADEPRRPLLGARAIP
jgi:hypothetical protein